MMFNAYFTMKGCDKAEVSFIIPEKIMMIEHLFWKLSK